MNRTLFYYIFSLTFCTCTAIYKNSMDNNRAIFDPERIENLEYSLNNSRSIFSRADNNARACDNAHNRANTRAINSILTVYHTYEDTVPNPFTIDLPSFHAAMRYSFHAANALICHFISDSSLQALKSYINLADRANDRGYDGLASMLLKNAMRHYHIISLQSSVACKQVLKADILYNQYPYELQEVDREFSRMCTNLIISSSQTNNMTDEETAKYYSDIANRLAHTSKNNFDEAMYYFNNRNVFNPNLTMSNQQVLDTIVDLINECKNQARINSTCANILSNAANNNQLPNRSYIRLLMHEIRTRYISTFCASINTESMSYAIENISDENYKNIQHLKDVIKNCTEDYQFSRINTFMFAARALSIGRILLDIGNMDDIDRNAINSYINLSNAAIQDVLKQANMAYGAIQKLNQYVNDNDLENAISYAAVASVASGMAVSIYKSAAQNSNAVLDIFCKLERWNRPN